eukprot:scaffold22577_cov40-Phaeocystis_antarctica.AAC.2
MTSASSGPMGSTSAKGEGLPRSDRYSFRCGASSVTKEVDDQCMVSRRLRVCGWVVKLKLRPG